jgi:glycosyltransferase involved in cell wall biosynthesis
MASDTTIVHVTHEAAGKVGGIGAVLAGLFTCNSYLSAVKRSIVVGPLFNTEAALSERLGADGQVLYSSMDRVLDTCYAAAFRRIENYYNAAIVYGRRTFTDQQSGITSSPEVLLINVTEMKKELVNEFKRRIFEEFGIQSHLYENLWEYEQYIRLAPVAIAVLKAIGAAKETTTIIAHEFMGMPTALAAILEPTCNFKTVFYAHEVATIRCIVEKHPGHDMMFYNAIDQAYRNGLYLSDLFGDQNFFFKHPLVKASKYCNSIYAVGNYTAKELRFLAPEFETADINVVYNGIPAYKIDVTEKQQSKEKLQLYCENLLGFRPDFIFTHVTRLVRSKGLWRDISVLYSIEKEFQKQGKTAVLFLLSTETAQRSSRDIYNMESAYNWPVAHREGWPDLSEGEANFYPEIQQFNARSRNIKIIFINQFGFEPKYCGRKMPKDMEFMDIRKGSDVEFSLSVYEPFGIASLEPLTYGGLCVISGVCGCAGFIRDIAGRNIKYNNQQIQAAYDISESNNPETINNAIIADYTRLDNQRFANIEDILHISQSTLSQTEDCISQKVAFEIMQRLPKSHSEMESLIESGYELARQMSWDVVVKNYLLPSLQKMLSKSHNQVACAKA